MSDYLASLVTRAREPQTAIRPSIVLRRPLVTPSMNGGPDEATLNAGARSVPNDQTRGSRGSGSGSAPAPAPGDRWDDLAALIDTAHPQTRTVEPASPAEALEVTGVSDMPGHLAPSALTDKGMNDTPASSSRPVVARRRLEATRVPRLWARDPRGSGEAGPVEASPAAIPPAIHVTIGRVEVRAQVSQPGSQARGAEPAMRGVSLEEHLRRRAGGGGR